MGGGVPYTNASAAALAADNHRQMLEDCAAAHRLRQKYPPPSEPMTDCRNCAAPLPPDSVCLYCGSHH